ncbi:MAG: FISUMP domain-containing protein [Bacteroidota bacterium]
MKLIYSIIVLLLAFNQTFAQQTGTLKDERDGKVYKTIKIGQQVWMAENLAHKPDTGNFWAYNNNENNIAIYGYLYDWETAKQIAPPGWHLPTKEEFEILLNNYNGENQKTYLALIKEGSSQMNIIFGGWCGKNNRFKGKNNIASYWTTDGREGTGIWNCGLNSTVKMIKMFKLVPTVGLSVRLIKD